MEICKSPCMGVAKNISDSAVIIFTKRKVDEIMSLAEVLTMEEKKKIIEAFGVEVAIQAFGVKKIIEAIGIEKGIQVVGTGKVFDAVGIEKVIEAIRVEKVINTLGRMLNLPEHEKKKLLMRYKKIKLNKK